MKTILLDNTEYKIDEYRCYILNNDFQPISYHRVLKGNYKENTKVVTSGHLYVLNYNKLTFTPKFPMTYSEFQLNGNKF